MAQGEHTLERSFTVKAGETVPARRFVDIDENGVEVTNGDADGISIDEGEDGDAIGVALLGPAKVEAAAEIQPGQQVEPDADGRAVPHDAATASGLALNYAHAPSGGDHDRTEIALGT